jgi:hypothetical protein
LRSEHQSLRHRALIVDEDRECDAPPELFEIRGGIGTLLANDIGFRLMAITRFGRSRSPGELTPRDPTTAHVSLDFHPE